MTHEPESKEVVATRKELFLFLALIMGIALSFHLLLKNSAQTLSATIFMATVIGTLMFWKLRVAIAFLGVVVLLLTGTIDLPHAIKHMSLDVIVFLIGMMVIMALLRRSGLFRWLLGKGLQLSGFAPHRLMFIILLLAAVMAAAVDEVTSILFVTALVLDLSAYFKVNPVKYVISVVLATNIGSSWTVLGNPIGILIALRSGLTFEDFMKTAFPIGIASLLALTVIVMIWQRKDLRLLKDRVKARAGQGDMNIVQELAGIGDKRLFLGSVILFTSVIIVLALHYRLEVWFGLEKNTLLVATSIAGAGIVMLWRRGEAHNFIQDEVEWGVLVFFMFLFAKAGTLEYVGISDVIATLMLKVAGGENASILTAVTLVFSGVASGAMDNVVVVAAFIPTLGSLTERLGTPVLWWALLFGGCYGGNMTMVGSTANIVALGMLERRVGHHMRFSYWIKIGLLGSLVPMAVGVVALLIMFR